MKALRAALAIGVGMAAIVHFLMDDMGYANVRILTLKENEE